jgi:predicted dehydrogenase
MKQIGIAVVGAGEIAQVYHLPLLNSIPNVKIIALYDINQSKAKIIAEKYDIPYVPSSLEELLSTDFVDAVDICTSTDAHYETAMKSIEAGKSIFIEKPIARNAEEAGKIADHAKKHGVKVMVGMNQRFRRDAIMLKNFISHGELGNLYYIKAGWNQRSRGQSWVSQKDISGGGVLIDLGLSIIDSLLWFCDFTKVKSVMASTYNHITKTVEDIAVATLRFDNGIVATLEVSWALFESNTTFYCNVLGNKGKAKINPIQLFKSDGYMYKPVSTAIAQNRAEIHKKSFEAELKHFVNVVADYSTIISSAEEAHRVMHIAEKIYESAALGKEIDV